MSTIITLSGMSTSGKSTLAKALKQTQLFDEAVSATTRPMRPGEINGLDYHFLNEVEFLDLVSKKGLLEYVKSHNAYYGVPESEVDRILGEGKCPVLVLEPIGVQSMQKIAQAKGINLLTLFVKTDMAVIFSRFFDRIRHQIEIGKPVSYDSEAKRMHTILTIEKSWEGSRAWDLTLADLHVNNNLDIAINTLIEFHQIPIMRQSICQAGVQQKSHSGFLSLGGLGNLIKMVIEGQVCESEFDELSKIHLTRANDLQIEGLSL